MTQKHSKIILWLEDIPDTVEKITHKLQEEYELRICKNLTSFADALNEYKDRISFIVLDIMIIGLNNLGAIGKTEILTTEGYDAGWRILEHFLRKDDSEYKDIPILIVSVTSLNDSHKGLIKRISNEGAKIDLLKRINPAGLRILIKNLKR